MTIPRLEALASYWVHSPPTHIMLAAFFEVGKKNDEKKSDVQPFGDIFKELPL